MSVVPRAIFIVCLIVAFVLGAIFVAVNTGPLRVELLLARPQLTVGQWLIGIFLVGWLAGVATVWRSILAMRRERKALRRKLRLAEAELKIVRPLSGNGS